MPLENRDAIMHLAEVKAAELGLRPLRASGLPGYSDAIAWACLDGDDDLRLELIHNGGQVLIVVQDSHTKRLAPFKLERTDVAYLNNEHQMTADLACVRQINLMRFEQGELWEPLRPWETSPAYLQLIAHQFGIAVPIDGDHRPPAGAVSP